MLINRLSIKQIINNRSLFASKKIKLITQLKRFKWDDPFVDERLLYRNIGDRQLRSDWWLCCGSVAFFTVCFFINIYMNWEEYKIADLHGFSYDNLRFSDKELGIPYDDDKTYAPLKKSILENNAIKDRGNTLRNENRWIYHAYAVRNGILSPYDN